MVDLNLYESTGHPKRLLVPELRGKLVHETRQVVRVKVEGEQPKAKIQVERLPDPGRAAERMVWTTESFQQALTKAPGSRVYQEAIARLWGAEFVDGWKRPTVSQVALRGAELLTVLEQVIAAAADQASV